MLGIIGICLSTGIYALGGFLWSLQKYGAVVAPFDPAIWLGLAFLLLVILRVVDRETVQ